MSGSVWVKVHPEFAGGGIPEGAPPAPLIDAASQAGGSVIKFTSGGDGAAGPTLAYGATITPDATVVVDQDNLEVAVSGATPDTDYVVEVFGMNVAGRGEGAKTAAFQLNYNDATGGDVVDEYTRLSDNTRWRYHQFTTAGSSTFTVGAATNPFRVLVVGAGGGAGAGRYSGSGCGGGGEVLSSDTQTLTLGEMDVVVAPQTPAVGNTDYGNAGANSEFAGMTARGGGLGSGGDSATTKGGTSGNGNAGWTGAQVGGVTTGLASGGAGSAAINQTTAGEGVKSDITGTEITYGSGSAGVYNPPAIPGQGAGGTGSHSTAGRASPTGGVVIVAYQIGTSTTRQIEQAQAEAAVREEGYATGYDVGVTDGREQAVEEARAMAASTLEVQE